jgi:zinc transport system substrate-binding protein
MKQQFSLFILLSTMVFSVLSFPLHALEPLQVVVSIPPQTYFVKQIGGELVEVMSMLPEGGLPHTYEPKPQQMKQLNNADTYIRIKVEFENAWWDKMMAANPNMHVVDSTEGVEYIEGHAHEHHEEEGEEHEHEGEHHEDEGKKHKHEGEHHEDEEEKHEHEGEHHEDEGEKHEHEGEHHEEEAGHHDHHGRDPHIWLSPRMVKVQAENIYQGLIEIDPEHKDSYTANKEAFLSMLDNLDAEIQAQLTDLKTRKFMIFHPAWTYFARDYNLEQIPIEVEGKEPSAKEIADLMKLAKQEHVTTIFIQPQASRRRAETIATQIGAKVEIHDPLAANWLENKQRVTGVLAKNLSK